MKKLIALLLAVGLLLTACSQGGVREKTSVDEQQKVKEQPSQGGGLGEKTPPINPSVEGVNESLNLSEVEDLEKDLNLSELDDLAKDLNELNW